MARTLDSAASRFDRWASSYEHNTLQQYLFVPVHQTALRLALRLQPRRGESLMSAAAPAGSCAGHDRATQPPS
jgi:hypothetical protein